ncbi:hypothetical protein BZA70DRAFT_276258 [Myxozyma melibiosi]|uniref:Transcription initiation factor IIF subunit alpha n=1 Tax=Myxozyma melibiosi TaxID=54550 RepID=A0ABR1F8X9_9ASCO
MSGVFRQPSKVGAGGRSANQLPASVKSEGSSAGSPGPLSTGSNDAIPQTEYRLRAFSQAEKAEKRFHVMKFYSRQEVDPTSFQQPVTMHRKDPRQLRYQQQQNPMIAEAAGTKTEEGAGDAMEDVKMTEKQPAAEKGTVAPDPELSIAPDGNGRRNRKALFQKKTRQVYTNHEEERRLRYEEFYPWLIEDFDGKNTWVGNYEAAQSDCYVLFVFDEDGFKMVPAEKWYKFTPRNKYATLSVEEAEAMMAKKNQPPRWLMKHMNPDGDSEEVAMPKKKMKTVDGEKRMARKRESGDDGDELDFDEEFADDEEAPIMEGPEDESKEVEQRVKRQMRAKNEDDDQGDDLFADDEDRKIGRDGKRLKQSLRALEKNAMYESDDDEQEEDPFASKAVF